MWYHTPGGQYRDGWSHQKGKDQHLAALLHRLKEQNPTSLSKLRVKYRHFARHWKHLLCVENQFGYEQQYEESRLPHDRWSASEPARQDRIQGSGTNSPVQDDCSRDNKLASCVEWLADQHDAVTYVCERFRVSDPLCYRAKVRWDMVLRVGEHLLLDLQSEKYWWWLGSWCWASKQQWGTVLLTKSAAAIHGPLWVAEWHGRCVTRSEWGRSQLVNGRSEE